MHPIKRFLEFAHSDDVVKALDYIAQDLRDRGWLTVMTGDDFADVLIQFRQLTKDKKKGFYLVISIVTSPRYVSNVTLDNCKRVSDFVITSLAENAKGWDPSFIITFSSITDCVVTVNGKCVRS